MFPVVARWLISALLLCGVYFAHAAQERYDYDGLGRLIRVIDEQGRVTDYVYDAAGNILQVIAGAAAQAPVISAILPNTLRRGETRAFQITGTGLTGAHLSAADPGLDITSLRVSARQILFNLTATMSAAIGSQLLTLSNAAGSTTVAITVNPVQPVLGMTPLPIAVPPTGAARSFFVSLSTPDNIAHVINIASANPAIATVSPASVTFIAGQTEAVVSIAGVSAGTTAINLTSATLPSTSVPVFVTSEFTGITTSFAQPLGVTLESAPGGTSTLVGPIVSPNVGVALGPYIAAVTPGVLVIGTGPTPVVISGAGLQGVTGVSIQPADGLSLGAISIAPDGLSVTVPVSVAADAPRTVRKVILTGAQQPYLPSRPDANQLLIAVPAPELSSIDPLVIAAGTTSATFTVRGRNLQNAQRVNISPPDHISLAAPPVVNADGTLLTTGISIALVATTGDRIVSVTTPSGTSSGVASPANTLRVVSEIQSIVTPVIAPLVGVVLGEPAPPTTSLSTYSSHVGVTFGPTISARTPGAAIIGETVQLTLNGSELQAVSAVELIPSTGVTVGAPSVSG
ncbi:MAG TPA: RHS repeat domain-containing protein, partial [Burkholderiales bacterium]|nr:RHS repeat domain-containing protein [Burkholderiales bacterium]